VPVTVPEIIPAKAFRRVQEHLHQRRPNVTAPKVTSSAVLLTGLARCHCCGGPLMLGTGKSSRYRYYVCANRRTKGRLACANPVSVSMAEFDSLVISALADQLLTPERLTSLLREAHRHRRRRTTLQKQLRETDKQLQRLYTALAEGAVDDTETFRGTVKGLEEKRDELTRHLSLLDTDSPPLRQALSKQQAASVASNLKRKLLDAPPALQRRYVRGLVSEITVDRGMATISGPPAAIAAAISSPDQMGDVRTFVPEWCPRQDSNLRPRD
jgi:site-specific DNA recombinase